MVILEVCRHELPELRAPGLRQLELGLRRQHQDPVRGRGPGRPADLAVRRDQARQRADGHCYSHLYGMPATGLRFFTVYGPWGRPDMAAFLFADAIIAGRPITLYNHGEMQRDFTYIDDIVAGVLAALDRPPAAPTARRAAPALQPRQPPAGRAAALRRGCSRRRSAAKAEINLAPLPPGDVVRTCADIEASRARPRLRAEDPDRGRPAALRRLVSRLSRGVSPSAPPSTTTCHPSRGREGLRALARWRFRRWVMLHVQSNPLPICTRPRVLSGGSDRTTARRDRRLPAHSSCGMLIR